MKIKEMLEDSRPREKLVKYGVQNITTPDLLALIFISGPRGKKGDKNENAIEMAERLITQYGLDKLSECSLKELQEIKGIGFAKACQIMALFEFNKRHNMAKTPIKKITQAKDVFDLFHERLKDKKQEEFWVLMLNNMNNIVKEQMVSRGVLDSAIIHPREVFREAIKDSSSKIIILHNHPSGNPTPSPEDVETTKKIARSGDLIGIKLVDHIVIGEKSYFSFKESRFPFLD